MANRFIVTTGSLRAKAAELRAMNIDFKTHVDHLRQQESSLNAMWDGQANDAFHRAFTSDAQQMDAFKLAIDQYCDVLLQIAEKYEKAENKNTVTANVRTYH